jgi:hypothetical protein
VGNWAGCLADKFYKMGNQVIRDIRHYELKPNDYVGDYDGILGNVYKSSFEIKCIGQRISRKLNELKFITDDFDHLYIYLNNNLDNGVIVEREFEYDKRARCFDFGQNRNEFNNMTDNDREKKINEMTFKVLNCKFGQDTNNKALIDLVEKLIEKEGRAIIINYKDKETKDYKLNIGFQISPTDNKSKIVIDYLVKKDDRKLRATVDLNHYEDIYYLVDKISNDGQQITLQPKKTKRTEFATEKYSTPLTIDIKTLQRIE